MQTLLFCKSPNVRGYSGLRRDGLAVEQRRHPEQAHHPQRFTPWYGSCLVVVRCLHAQRIQLTVALSDSGFDAWGGKSDYSSANSAHKVFAGSRGSVDDARAARRASVVAQIADLRRKGYLTDIGIKTDSHGEPDLESIQTLFNQAKSPYRTKNHAVMKGDLCEGKLYPSLRLNDPLTWFAGLPISGNNRLVQRDLKRRVDWLFWAMSKALRQLRSRKALRQLR